MMKLFRILGMMLSVSGLCAVMTACDSSDSPDGDGPGSITSVNVEYSMDLSPTWFDFYDIVVTYCDQHGETNHETVTEKWSYSFSVAPVDAPDNYLFTVVAVPKDDRPELYEARYVLSDDIEGKFFCYRNDGTINNSSTSGMNAYTVTDKNTLTLTAEEFEDYLNQGGRSLMQFRKSWNKLH